MLHVVGSVAAFAAVKADGSVITWGAAGDGGDSSAVRRHLTSDVQEVVATRLAFAALKSDGSVVTWGNGRYGGDSSAVRANLASGVVQISASSGAFAALIADGLVVTWGYECSGGTGCLVQVDEIGDFSRFDGFSHGIVGSLRKRRSEDAVAPSARRLRLRRKASPGA